MKKLYYILLLILFILFTVWWYFNYGSWLYIDNKWLLFFKHFGNDIGRDIFNSFSAGTYFWFDKTSTVWPRFINTYLAAEVNQFLMYIIYFAWSFVFSFLFLSRFLSKKSAFLGGLLFTFNPVSIHFLNYASFSFTYFSIASFLYWALRFLETKRVLFLFIALLSLNFMFAYVRMAGITLTVIFIVWIMNFKFIKYCILTRFKKSIIPLFILPVLVLLPFLVWHIYPLVESEPQNFKWVANYRDQTSQYSQYLFNKENNELFLEGIIPKSILDGFATDFQDSSLFIYYSIYFILLVLISGWVFIKNKTLFYNVLLWIVLFLFFFKKSALFVSPELFEKMVYKYYPFIAWEPDWIFVLFISFFCFLTAYTYSEIEKKEVKNLLFYSGIWYVILSLFPFLNWTSIWMQTVKQEDIPQTYIDTFQDSPYIYEAASFFPINDARKNGYVLPNWSPYPLRLEYNYNYKNLLSSNYRVVNTKQSDLWGEISRTPVKNSKILNQKNFFVITWVQNPEHRYYWYNNTKDIETAAQKQYENFSNIEYLEKATENEDFTIFRFDDADEYEFFIYSPWEIVYTEDTESFFNEQLDFTKQPLIIDLNAFSSPLFRGKYQLQIPSSNSNINVEYKKSYHNNTKYFVKLSNVDTSSLFMLQLNQTFDTNWKIKWIDKEEYEKYNCNTQSERIFPLSNNSNCLLESDNYLSSIYNYKYLNSKTIPSIQHFEGNLVWNSWLISPNDLREQDKWNSELYAVVIFEKQLWYIWSILISLWTLFALFILAMLQELYFTAKKGIWNKKRY